MSLSAGIRLGPYEIVAPLGVGGMGEVYRARDTRLDRTVAVKVLPAHLSDSAAARERFEREARAISALSHPNICHLYDVGSHDGVRYLVMEYLEGETLADRLERGPLPLDEVLRRGMEICAGLEQAHRSGVVHRDLKPANIMLTKTGAKLLDFGLAKLVTDGAAVSDPGNPAVSTSRTASRTPLTAEGSWVGTCQYMSPEQIEGRPVDARSDIFSLGAVLYEMLTGRRAFDGKSALSVASAILEKEPQPIATLKPMAPQALDHAIRTCLAKSPEKRWQTVSDLSLLLGWMAEGGAAGRGADTEAGAGGRQEAPAPGAARRPRARERALIAALVLTSVAALGFGLSALRREAPREQERVILSNIRPMAGSSLLLSDASGLALSPDGRNLVYVASTPDAKFLLWLRPLDSLVARPLVGTNGAKYPFWSPDGRSIGFFAGGKLKTVDTAGGPALTVCEAGDGRGGTWNRDGVILFTPGVNSPLQRVPATGGASVVVTSIDPSKNEISHRWPVFLPDGRHFLYLAGSVFTSTENPTNVLKIGSLDSSESTVLVRTHAGGLYASGQVLYLRQSTLLAQPLDQATLTLTGSPTVIADPVNEAELFSKGMFTASDNGMLAYMEGRGGADRQLVWYDRSGRQIGAVPAKGPYACPGISPDGKRLLYYLDSGGFDVWTYDLARGVKTPQTFGSGGAQVNIFPRWSRDGRSIVFTSYRDGKYFLMRKAADGSSEAEVLLDGVERYRFPGDWSPDGRFITMHEGSKEGWSIWILPLTGDRKPFPFMNAPYSTRDAAFSPDGRWVAYCSTESGEYRVYVAPFPGPGGKWQVSQGAGYSPRWRRDGREIFYYSADNQIVAVPLRIGANTVEVGAPKPLFLTNGYGVFGRFDVSADGQRFIVPYEPGEPTSAITLKTNWPAEARRGAR